MLCGGVLSDTRQADQREVSRVSAKPYKIHECILHPFYFHINYIKKLNQVKVHNMKDQNNKFQ